MFTFIRTHTQANTSAPLNRRRRIPIHWSHAWSNAIRATCYVYNLWRGITRKSVTCEYTANVFMWAHERSVYFYLPHVYVCVSFFYLCFPNTFHRRCWCMHWFRDTRTIRSSKCGRFVWLFVYLCCFVSSLRCDCLCCETENS